MDRKWVLLPASGLVLLLVLCAGCGGTSSSGGGNGRSLSEVMTKKDVEDQDRDERRRSEDQTRTRSHDEPIVDESKKDDNSDNYYVSPDDDYASDYETVQTTASVLSFLFNVFFSGDEEEKGSDAALREKDEGGEKKGSKVWAGYRHSWSRLAGDAITGFESGTVMLGLRGGKGTLGYAGLYFGNGTTGRAEIDEAITNLDEVGLELGLMTYLTPSRSKMGAYIELGLRFGAIGWDYRDTSLGPTSDYLGEFGGFLGLGLAILQTRHIHLGASAFGGVRFMGEETEEGFQNDVFKDVGFYQVNLKAIVLF